jgi:hypothetical protein
MILGKPSGTVILKRISLRLTSIKVPLFSWLCLVNPTLIRLIDVWGYGHELFRSTPESFPVPFIAGNVLDSGFLKEHKPYTSTRAPPSLEKPLTKVETLDELRGNVSAIFAGAFFHVFDEEGQAEVARRLAGLLSPKKGSMLLGEHGGRSKKGIFAPNGPGTEGGKGFKMFCHSPESWKELWEGILGKENVEVNATLKKALGGPTFFDTFPGNTNQYYLLVWSVTRK